MNATDLRLLTVSGGAKDNAIPRDAKALVAVKDVKAAEAAALALGDALKNEYRTADPDIRVSLVPADSELVPMDEDSTRRVAAFLFCAPNGVQMMSAEVPGLVQTSLNLGQVYTDGDAVGARFMIRSSVNSQAAETTEKVITLTRALGGAVEIPASYSAWQYRPDSHLRDVMVEAFRAVYGEEPTALRGGVLHTGDLGRLDWAGRLILTGRKKEMLVLMDGTKLFLPEYEGAIARALGTPDLCVVLEDRGPILIVEGPEQEKGPLWEKLKPVMAQLPRGQQLRGMEFYGGSLPRTASGKIMRWAVQREGKEEK